MKIPLKWLADYVALDLPVAELARRLTMAGLEVGAFRSFGLPVPEGLRIKQDEPGPVWDRDKVVVAQLVSVEKHPNADKLKLPTVEYGDGRPCGWSPAPPTSPSATPGERSSSGWRGPPSGTPTSAPGSSPSSSRSRSAACPARRW